MHLSRFRLSLLLSLTLLIVLAFSLSLSSPVSHAQNVPSLEGMNIYFSESNRELSRFDRSDRGISRYSGILSRLGANQLTLEWRKGIPEDANMIAIIAPITDLSAEQVARLWAYMRRGGRVLIITESVDGVTYNRTLGARGFFELTWNDLGLRAREDILVQQGLFRDIQVVERDRDGNVTSEYTTNVPQLIVDFNTSDFNTLHPISANLQGELFYSTSRSIEFDSTIQRYIVTPLIYDGSADSYGETAFSEYLRIGVSEYNIGADTGQARTAIAVSYEDPVTGGRLVLIGDGDIVRNGTGFQTSPAYSPNFLYPTNVQFMSNVTAWLLDRESPLLDFPAPEATATATITPTATFTPSPTLDVTATPSGA